MRRLEVSTIVWTVLVGAFLSVALAAQSNAPAAHPAGAAHRAFVIAVARGNLNEAQNFMSRALVASLPASGGLWKVCADRVGPGTIVGIQTVSTEVKGEKAVVRYRFELSDGSSRFGSERLVLENGQWKLDLKETTK